MLRKQCVTGLKSRVTSVLGCQWGDEGKGKLVDILAKDHDIVARFNGGSNAGHTLKVDGKKYVFHLLPCGMLYDTTINVLGNGVVINLSELFQELEQIEKNGRKWEGKLLVSDRAQLTFEAHRMLDRAFEKRQNLGTTMKGIGPTYAFKAFRSGLRVGEILRWDSFVEKYTKFNVVMKDTYGIEVDQKAELDLLKMQREKIISAGMIQDTVGFINNSLNQGKRVLAEGANALMLDIDFGTYPYVTSSNTSVGAICTGLSIPPGKIEAVIGVVKAYTTRVGEGPFFSEDTGAAGAIMGRIGVEFGSTTGRPRRCGWLDLAVVRYAHMINNLSSINITKLDVLSEFEKIEVVTHYENKVTGKKVPYMPANLDDCKDLKTHSITLKGWKSDISQAKSYSDLPVEARDYLSFIETEVGVPVSWVGVGAGREAMILNPVLQV